MPGFRVTFTASKPREAQQICNELTTLLVDENLKSVQAAASGTSDVLSKGIDDAKRHLEELDSKLAAFKKQYVGQLPGDEENNLKILMGLNSQLEANTQTLNRAQQDRAYTESLLAQQLAAWKSSQSSTNPQTLQKQLSDLQSELLQLQARYTEDHPDVIKAKADIAEVKKKLAEINKASSDAPDSASDKASAMEPPEIRQLRLQIHQYGDLIAAATRDQKRYQQEIAVYQGRVSLSPSVEEAIQGADAGLRKWSEELSGPSGQEEHGGSDGQYEQPVRGGADVSAEPGGLAGLAEFSESPVVCGRRPGCGTGAWNRTGDVAGVAGHIHSHRSGRRGRSGVANAGLSAVGGCGGRARQERQAQVLESE